jgi:hypothetical protein
MASGLSQGFKVAEFVGPGPFCGILLSDMDTDVSRIDGKGANASSRFGMAAIDRRGRNSVSVDLKRRESLTPGICGRLPRTLRGGGRGTRRLPARRYGADGLWVSMKC